MGFFSDILDRLFCPPAPAFPADFVPFKGTVTRYGYKGDECPDSASMGTGAFKRPTGAWDNALDSNSLAISPDVEKAFRAAGIEPKEWVKIRLSSGINLLKRWDDRTGKAYEGKPEVGRFDIYSFPDIYREFDGLRVVGFSKDNV